MTAIPYKIPDAIQSSSRQQACLLRLAEDRTARGEKEIVSTALKAYALLESWDQSAVVCLAGLLTIFSINCDDQDNPCLLAFRRTAGKMVAQISAAATEILKSITLDRGPVIPRFTTISDNGLCDIVAAITFLRCEGGQLGSPNSINNAFRAVSRGITNSAYEHYLNSNILLALPTDIHARELDETSKRLCKSPMQIVPCPHTYATDVFSPNYYETMLRLLPDQTQFKPIPSNAAYQASCKQYVGISGDRFHIWLRDLAEASARTEDVDQDIRNHFWKNFASSLVNSTLISELTCAFSCELNRTCNIAIRLVREVGAAYIAPHLDMSHKPLTLLFYLAEHARTTGQGTSLYEPVEASCDFRVHKTFPWCPNAALLLPRTDQAFHGVEPHRLRLPRTTLHVYLQDRSYQGTKVFPS